MKHASSVPSSVSNFSYRKLRNQYRCGNDFISTLVVGSGFFPYIGNLVPEWHFVLHVYLMCRWWSPLHNEENSLRTLFFRSSSEIGATRAIHRRGRAGRGGADTRVRGGLRQSGLQDGIQPEPESRRTAAAAPGQCFEKSSDRQLVPPSCADQQRRWVPVAEPPSCYSTAIAMHDMDGGEDAF